MHTEITDDTRIHATCQLTRTMLFRPKCMSLRELTTDHVAPRACSSSHDGSPLHNWSRCTGLIALLVWHVRFRTEPPETLGISDVQTWRIAHAVRGRTDVHGGSVRRRITPVAIHRRGNLSKTRSPRKSRPRALQVRITVCWADSERSLTPLTVTYQAIGISLVQNCYIFLRTTAGHLIINNHAARKAARCHRARSLDETGW